MSTTNEWVHSLPNKIYRILKAVTFNDVAEILQNPKYITIDETVDFTSFPTIRIGSLSPIEIGNTLDGVTVNGVTLTEQIEVYTNTSTTDANNISFIMLEAMKLLGFRVVAFPEVRTQNNGVFVAVARYRRDYGANDTI